MIEDSSGFLEDSRALEVSVATASSNAFLPEGEDSNGIPDDSLALEVGVAIATSVAFLSEGKPTETSPLESSTADSFGIHPASCILHRASLLLFVARFSLY
jgi:hypothetical protein